MKKFFHFTPVFLFVSFGYGQSSVLLSPDGKTKVTIDYRNGFTYSVNHSNNDVIDPSPIGIFFHEKPDLIKNNKVYTKTQRQVNETVNPVVHEKRKSIPDHYNELKVSGKSGLSI